MKAKPITLVGLILSIFGYMLILTITNLSPLSRILSEHFLSIIGLILVWVLVTALLVIVKTGEERTLRSIGFKSISRKEVFLAIGFGLVLSITVPLLTLLASQIVPSNGGDIDEVVSNSSWMLILISILTAGITEEIVFRGFIIERMHEITNKVWLSVLFSIIAFILPHTVSWNMTHVIAVVLPLGIILTGLYMWKRNVIFNMIVHIVIDLPLVFMALVAP